VVACDKVSGVVIATAYSGSTLFGGGFPWGYVLSLFGRCSSPCHTRASVEYVNRSSLKAERNFQDEMNYLVFTRSTIERDFVM